VLGEPFGHSLANSRPATGHKGDLAS
jgi:hypothetical protein